MRTESIKFPLYLIVHPFNGYWDLKYDQNHKRSLVTSFIILFTLILTNILHTQYSGFLVNIVHPDDINSLMEMVYVLVPVLYWCVANWSLTTLMDGEGRFVDIFNSTCYALLPLILVKFPWIWLSNYIVLDETAFYYFSDSFAVMWVIFLIFVGNMTVHQFSASKTIGTLILTIVAVGFLAFLTLLFFSLIQQIISFVTVIYQEIALRS